MRVSVSFLGVLKDQAGMADLSVELPDGATYRDLVSQIDALLGHSLAAWAWNREEKSFTPFVLVMKNLVDIEDESTPLADGDEILIVAPAAGGERRSSL